ncbi:MAG: GlxA family transcriptional regulator [Rhodobacteraceae bacterium]|nr:GlxA family transcriptional regulator [Paracoccaceae bacterium]
MARDARIEAALEADTREIGFLLIDEFPLLSLSGAVDVLRHANRFAGRKRFLTRVYTPSGGPALASNLLEIAADRGLDDDARPHMLFVVCGFHPERVTDEKVLSWLRRLASRGVGLGGISAGAFVLARAGLLEGHQCAVHWEYAGPFREMWPTVELTDRLYVIDGARRTCAGGSATIDMFLRLVVDELGPEHGPDVAAKAAEQMLVERVRSTMDRQTSAALFHAKSRSEGLAAAIEAMEGAMDAPLSMLELAQIIGLTRRQLHRLFREHTGQSPTDFYRELRLRYARTLLRRTSTKVIDVALASGFGSHSHFSKVYREHFGVSPLKDRREEG